MNSKCQKNSLCWNYFICKASSSVVVFCIKQAITPAIMYGFSSSKMFIQSFSAIGCVWPDSFWWIFQFWRQGNKKCARWFHLIGQYVEADVPVYYDQTLALSHLFYFGKRTVDFINKIWIGVKCSLEWDNDRSYCYAIVIDNGNSRCNNSLGERWWSLLNAHLIIKIGICLNQEHPQISTSELSNRTCWCWRLQIPAKISAPGWKSIRGPKKMAGGGGRWWCVVKEGQIFSYSLHCRVCLNTVSEIKLKSFSKAAARSGGNNADVGDTAKEAQSRHFHILTPKGDLRSRSNCRVPPA